MSDDQNEFDKTTARNSANLDIRVNQHRREIAEKYEAATLNIAATGDSWFNYPLTDNNPFGTTDTIASLRPLLAEGTTLVNLAVAGDPTTEMLGAAKRARLAAMLADRAGHGTFDAILFSAGGDDIAGDVFRFWLNEATADLNPQNAVNRATFTAILDIVESGYRDLIALRDATVPGVPIFVHAYDFAYPDNRGILGALGPWLFPSLQQRGWMKDTSPPELARGHAIITAMLQEFDGRLARLAADPAHKVVHVQTQGVLDGQAEWANEMHPTAEGFGKVAARFAAALAAAYPDRSVLRPAGS